MDIVLLSFYNQLNTKNVFAIDLIDSEVENNFYGVVVITNGMRYQTYEDIPKYERGIRYYLSEEKWNSLGSIHNAGMFEANSNYTYDEVKGNIINQSREYEMNIYFDKLKITSDPVIGLVYSSGIKYVETLDRNYNTYREYEGEQGYALPEGIYLSHSMNLKFKIHFRVVASFNKLEVYEYDMNHNLLNVSTLLESDHPKLVVNKDAIYAYIKVYTTTPYGPYETFKTYRVNVGDQISLAIADEHGMVWNTEVSYSYYQRG